MGKAISLLRSAKTKLDDCSSPDSFTTSQNVLMSQSKLSSSFCPGYTETVTQTTEVVYGDWRWVEDELVLGWFWERGWASVRDAVIRKSGGCMIG